MPLHVLTELIEYALSIHCKFSFGMCRSLPVYGSKMDTDAPSAMLIIKQLVHAATMHTDAKVLRVGAGGSGERESGVTAFSSHAAGISVLPFGVVVDDDESGVENMREPCRSRSAARVVLRIFGVRARGNHKREYVAKNRRGGDAI
jgi:hypothetical protein